MDPATKESNDGTPPAGKRRRKKRDARVRTMARIRSLSSLIGGHPEALREIYTAGKPCDTSLLEQHDARLLSLEPARPAYMLSRALLVKVARDWLPGDGRKFETGGTAGAMRLFAGVWLRFRCEAGPSQLDGEPCLRLAYDELGNRWPLSNIVEELRTVGEGIAIGPGMLAPDGRVLWWWGISGTR